MFIITWPTPCSFYTLPQASYKSYSRHVFITYTTMPDSTLLFWCNFIAFFLHPHLWSSWLDKKLLQVVYLFHDIGVRIQHLKICAYLRVIKRILFPCPFKRVNSRCQLYQNVFLVQTLQEPKNTRHLQLESLPSASIQNRAVMRLGCMAPFNLRTNLLIFLAKSLKLHSSVWRVSLKLIYAGIWKPIIFLDWMSSGSSHSLCT